MQGIVPDRSYVAFGLSQDSEAGDDSVIACNNIGEVTAYWYTGDHTTLKSSDQAFINATSTSQDGDVLFCSFILPADFSLQTQAASPSAVALNSGAYSLSLGQGNENNGNLQEPDERGISEQSFVFSEYNRFIGGGYDGCFEVKGCFGTSAGCVESRSCTSYTTYMVNSDGSVSFTITGDGVVDSNYISFGLSETEGMPEAIVMYCFIGSGGVVQVRPKTSLINILKDTHIILYS